MRRILLQHLVDIPHHGVGIERRAVVKGDAGAKLERPFLLVGVVDLPFGRKAGDHDARLIGGGEVPHRERIVHCEAGEAVALKALIRLAQRARNVGRRHSDPQRRLSEGRLRQSRRQPAREREGQRRFLPCFGTHQSNPFFNFT